MKQPVIHHSISITDFNISLPITIIDNSVSIFVSFVFLFSGDLLSKMFVINRSHRFSINIFWIRLFLSTILRFMSTILRYMDGILNLLMPAGTILSWCTSFDQRVNKMADELS
uniref:Uncharacterized protein n=1 Tax=Cacopsylla melanoneura TaxID=428564 RepID=A0A8D8WQ26_9HEMI